MGGVELEHLWPDRDRRDGALERLEQVVGADIELTAAERNCLLAVSHGLTEREAADLLGYDPASTHDRLQRSRRVLGAKTTTQAVAIALRLGLIV